MCSLWLGYKIGFYKNEQKNQLTAAREQAWQHVVWEEEATKHWVEKKRRTHGQIQSISIQKNQNRAPIFVYA